MYNLDMDMRQRLEELGLREEYNEPRKLCSGLESRVFWDIEKLFERKASFRQEIIRPWAEEIGRQFPKAVIGIPTGGRLLARDVCHILRLPTPLSYNRTTFQSRCYPCILVDDVLTTGETALVLPHRLGKVWGDKLYSPFTAIAVLVNRSGLDEIEGIPIISGIKADPIEEL